MGARRGTPPPRTVRPCQPTFCPSCSSSTSRASINSAICWFARCASSFEHLSGCLHACTRRRPRSRAGRAAGSPPCSARTAHSGVRRRAGGADRSRVAAPPERRPSVRTWFGSASGMRCRPRACESSRRRPPAAQAGGGVGGGAPERSSARAGRHTCPARSAATGARRACVRAVGKSACRTRSRQQQSSRVRLPRRVEGGRAGAGAPPARRRAAAHERVLQPEHANGLHQVHLLAHGVVQALAGTPRAGQAPEPKSGECTRAQEAWRPRAHECRVRDMAGRALGAAL